MADQKKRMSDKELCRVIDAEAHSSIGQEESSAADRQRALDYYLGNAVGNLAAPDVDGLSRVVSRDVAEVVDALMPTLMRTFAGSEEPVSFEPAAPGQEAGAQQATTYINYVIHRQNPGFLILHDAIKNALIQRIGIIKVWWDESYEETEQSLSGLSQVELAALQQDPEVVTVKAEQDGIDMLQQPTFSAVVARRFDRSCERIEGVPPDQFRMSRDARTLDDVRFTAHVRELTKSDLRGMGLKEEIIDSLSDTDGNSVWNDDALRASAQGDYADNDPADESQQTVEVFDCWLKVDFDKDGIAEWRHVMKCGATVITNEVCDGHPFAIGSPILMPYQAVGLSLHDQLKDVQDVSTAVTRQTLDNLFLANNQRIGVLDGQVNMDDLLNPRPGGAVRMKQLDAIRPIEQPVIIGPALEMLANNREIRRERTGVNGQGDSVVPEATNRSGVAVDLMQTAGRERVELICRVFAETLIKDLYRKVLKLSTEKQNGTKQLRVNGQFLEFDPRAWSNQYGVTISVGLGAMSKQSQIAALNQILAIQKEALAAGMVQPQHVYATVKRMVEALGFRDTDQFFPNPATMPPADPAPPQPDPAMVMAQAEASKAQAAQMKAQTDLQAAEMEKAVKLAELQLEERRQALAEAEFAHKQQMDMANLQIDTHKATEKDRSLQFEQPLRAEFAALMQQIQQQMAAVSQTLQAVTSAHQQLAQQVTAPRQIVRDDAGNVVGIQVGGGVRHVQRDDAGNVVGLE